MNFGFSNVIEFSEYILKMQKFVHKSFIYFLPILILFSVLEYKLSKIPTYYSIKKIYLESQISEIEVLSVGSSHGNSINPAYIDKKSFNLSHDAQDIYYDVKLINKYIEKMSNLKLIILPISYWSLEYRLDKSILSNRASFYRLVYDIPPQIFGRLFKLESYSYLAAYGWNKVRMFIHNNFASEATLPLSRGGWRDTGHSSINETAEEKRIGNQGPLLDEAVFMNPDNLDKNLSLIQELINLCKYKKIKIIFITTPVFNYYYDSIDGEKYLKWQENIKKIILKNDIPYYNFLNSTGFISSDFYSEDHLNCRGAEKFSRIMNEIVNEVLD